MTLEGGTKFQRMARGRKVALRSIFVLVIAAVALVLVPSKDSTGDGSVARAAASGKILFARGGEIWMSHDGSNVAITQGGRYWAQPDWAPDGTKLAIVGWGANSTDIFTLASDASDLRQITRGQSARMAANEWMFFPRWSPDGQTLAYLSDRSTNSPMIWTMRADGSNQRQLTRPRGLLDSWDTFSWSPDGTQLVATGFTGATSQIYLINVARPEAPRALTSEPGGAFDPTWSPDGASIAYATRDGRRYSVRMVSTESSEPPITLLQADMARAPRWAPSGSALAYLALAGSEFEVFVVNLTFDPEGHIFAGRPSQVTNRLGVDATSGLSWIP